MSAEPVTPQQIPRGLTIALAPAQEHCKRGGGVPSFVEVKEGGFNPHSLVKARLPQRILCIGDGSMPVWALDVSELEPFDGPPPNFRRSID